MTKKKVKKSALDIVLARIKNKPIEHKREIFEKVYNTLFGN